MGKTWIAAMAAALCLVGCTHPAGKTDPQLRAIEDSITAGNYDAAVSQTRAVEAQSPAPSCAPQALYLEGYAMAYGWGDYRRARKPLEQLLDAAPAEPLASKALRLLADCDYWQGYYARAIREYQKLSSSPDPETR
ncbi:MAG TPA: hypothetical protein VFR02_02055, partial [bacterium]|nr:hypothetical protein [bacterium]